MYENRLIATAPMAIKNARITRATAMPNRNTFCWYSFGTARVDMMMRSTMGLSTERPFSISRANDARTRRHPDPHRRAHDAATPHLSVGERPIRPVRPARPRRTRRAHHRAALSPSLDRVTA